MATISRPAKASAGGGTSYLPNTSINSSEVNGDVDTIVNDYNGNITDANMAAVAAVNGSKIDDHSDTNAIQATATSPGNSGSESLPTQMEQEIERLRYKLEELNLGVDADRVDASGVVDCSWIDLPYRGPNLLRNGDFSSQTGGAGTAPDGWALVSGPTTVAIQASPASEGDANEVRIVANASLAEGIQQVVSGLKSSTRYLIAARMRVNVGTMRLRTLGADSASSFRNIDISSTSTSFVTLKGVVQTDATPTDITVQLLSDADATLDDFDTTHVGMWECNTDVIGSGGSHTILSQNTTNTVDHYTTAAFVDSGVSAAVTVPGPGYEIEVFGKIAARQSETGGTSIVGRLLENSTEVDSAHQSSNAAGWRTHLIFHHVNRSPAPGTTFTYQMDARASTAAWDRNGAAVFTETPRTFVEVTLRRQG